MKIKLFLFCLIFILPGQHLLAQNVGSIGVYGSLFAMYPTATPRCYSTSVCFTNSIGKVEYDLGLRYMNDKPSTSYGDLQGYPYKLSYTADYLIFFANGGWKLMSLDNVDGFLRLGISLGKIVYCHEVAQSYDGSNVTTRDIECSGTGITATLGWKVSVPIGNRLIINIIPNVNLKTHQEYNQFQYQPDNWYYLLEFGYPNFHFYYGIDVGLAYRLF